MIGLLDRIGFAFQVNYHSNGQWLLYPEGWQIGTPTADDPIYYAMSGNLDKPGDRRLPPGPQLGRPLRHQRRDDRLRARQPTGTLAWTPELSEGCDGCGFVFPDDEALVQAEFERNLPFAQSVARLGGRPRRPEDGRPGIDDQAVLPRQRRPLQERHPGRPADASPSPTATRSRSPCSPSGASAPSRAKYRINGGARAVGADAGVDAAARRTTRRRVYYHQMRGVVTGTEPGRLGRGLVRGRRPDERRRSPTTRSPRPATRCSSWRPRTTPAPRRCRPAGPALRRLLPRRAGGQRRATPTSTTSTPRGRIAPDALGVLSHYDAVVW